MRRSQTPSAQRAFYAPRPVASPPAAAAASPAAAEDAPPTPPPMKRPPHPTFRPLTTTAPLRVNVSAGNEDEPQQRLLYFSVVWRKTSTKKHKSWDGDGVLVVAERSCKLLDSDANEIGKCTTYPADQLAKLKVGESLSFSAKELEVVGTIDDDTFKRGACFISLSKSGTGSSLAPAPPPPRPAAAFKSPSSSGVGSAAGAANPAAVVVQPRHDATAPDALVMPRPAPVGKTPVVDVVVDPYIASCLRPHQREGVKFMYECVMELKDFKGAGAILADEMGLGKTLQTISLIWTLLKQNPHGGGSTIKRALVVCPASLVQNWQKEFKKWLGDERCKTFAVQPNTDIGDFTLSSIFSVIIIGYERFRQAAHVLAKAGIGLIVCDEGHRLKNSNIKTALALQQMASRRRVILSGTPIQNDLAEFFAMVDFVNPGILGDYKQFKRVFEDPIVESRQKSCSPADVQLGASRSAELTRLTGLFVLRRTQDINQKYLPPKTEMVLFCPPSPVQLRVYREILQTSVIRSCFSDGSANSQLLGILVLRKLCNSPLLLHQTIQARAASHSAADAEGDEDLRNVDADALTTLHKQIMKGIPGDFAQACADGVDSTSKLVALRALLLAIRAESAENKVVIVSNFTQTLDMIARVCDADKFEYIRLDGSTPVQRRQHLVEQFNSPYTRATLFLLSAKSGGTGLNLVGASRLVLFDIDWNPATDAQAMARIWRDGQKRPVTIFRLLTVGTLEEKMYQRQLTKLALSATVMGDGPSSKNNFSQDELRDLFTLHDDTACLTHDLLDCTCQQQSAEGDAPTAAAKRQKRTHGISISELMEWQHFSGDAPDGEMEDFAVSDLLRRKLVSFVFQRRVEKVE